MKAKVLFVCVENSCRSQMSEGMAKKLGPDVIEAWSAGSKPSGKVNPMAIEALKEVGVDPSAQHSKGLDDLPGHQWDYVITMGCGDACPHLPAKNRLDWDLADPKNKPMEEFRKTRDDIAHRLKGLIHDIKVWIFASSLLLGSSVGAQPIKIADLPEKRGLYKRVLLEGEIKKQLSFDVFILKDKTGEVVLDMDVARYRPKTNEKVLIFGSFQGSSDEVDDLDEIDVHDFVSLTDKAKVAKFRKKYKKKVKTVDKKAETSAPARSIESRLRELENLKSKKLISQEEYDKIRQKILYDL